MIDCVSSSFERFAAISAPEMFWGPSGGGDGGGWGERGEDEGMGGDGGVDGESKLIKLISFEDKGRLLGGPYTSPYSPFKVGTS